MNLTVIGWYGTETIGDRAILAGLISRISNVVDVEKVLIGALNPFFTERTILEDADFIMKISNKKIKVQCFNSKSVPEMNQAIIRTDLLIMGGGPIMEIQDLFMLEYAFQYAKQKNKKTGIMGCGFCPLYSKKFKKSALSILRNSDKVIFRDTIARNNALNLINEYGDGKIDTKTLAIGLDPAIETALKYLEIKNSSHMRNNKSRIVVNLRDLPRVYDKQQKKESIHKFLISTLDKIAGENSDKELLLVPMHYFRDGNDDRDYLNHIMLNTLGKTNIKVQNNVLTLEDTFDVFFSAYATIGMRFHSVVLMTILNKNNFILDYTDSQTGKIIGFLKDVDKFNFYTNRYINLHNIDKNYEVNWKLNNNDVFDYDKNLIEVKLSVYDNEIKNICR